MPMMGRSSLMAFPTTRLELPYFPFSSSALCRISQRSLTASPSSLIPDSTVWIVVKLWPSLTPMRPLTQTNHPMRDT